MWLLPLVIAANLQDFESFRRVSKVIVWLGVLIALGTVLEIASLGELQLVSTYRQVALAGTFLRVWPDAWVFMIVAGFLSLISLLAWRKPLGACGIFGLIITGIILTQGRVMILSFVGVAFIVLALVAMSKHTGLLARRAVLPAAAVIVIALGLSVAADQVRGLSDWVIQRYETMGNAAGGRIYELTRVKEVLMAHPLSGLGLGVRYRDVLPETDYEHTGGMDLNDDGTFVHNFLGFCIVKLGMPGTLAFLWFSFAIMQRVFKYSMGQCEPAARRYGLALSGGLLALVIIAQSSNVFGDISQVPIAALVAGLLAAFELLPRAAGMNASHFYQDYGR